MKEITLRNAKTFCWLDHNRVVVVPGNKNNQCQLLDTVGSSCRISGANFFETFFIFLRNVF